MSMFESLKIGSIVKTHFILLVKEMKTQHDESMRVLKHLQQEKETENENFKSTCAALRKLYATKGGPDDGKYQRVIECLESQIQILREAKVDYLDQLQRIKSSSVDTSEL